MKTIITLDKADQPYGFPQLDGNSELHITGSLSGTASSAINAVTLDGTGSQVFATTGSFNAFTSSYNTGSFSGSFKGDGAGLYNIPASGIVGLNLSQIISGSVSASISPTNGLQINTNVTATAFTGSLFGTASLASNAITSSYALTASYVDGGTY